MIEAEPAPAVPVSAVGAIAPASDLGPVEIGAGASAGELAFAALRTQFGEVLAHEAGTRLGEDPERLHDMRVALRRMRAALKTFRDSLPPRIAGLGRELAWLSGTLGPVRDLDVQLARLHTWHEALDLADRPALDALAALLSRRREAARRRMLRALDSGRYGRLVERVERELRRGPGRAPAAGRRAAVIQAPEIVVRRYKSMIKHGREIDTASPPEQYHRLRIRCRGLRYALEFRVALWGAPARRMIRAIVGLQDLLGEHQDAEVAARDLRVLAARGGLPRPTVFVIGRIAERCTTQAAALRRRLRATLAELRGPRWRRLRRAMEQRALQSARSLPRRLPGR